MEVNFKMLSYSSLSQNLDTFGRNKYNNQKTALQKVYLDKGMDFVHWKHQR